MNVANLSEGMMPYPMPDIKTEIKEECDGEPPKKKRGRKKGSKNQNKKQTTITDTMPIRKKRDRFNGMPEEEVVKRVLPDHLTPDLDIVIVGINPGLCAAYVGHHYAGPGNHFWKCMFLSGLIPEPLTAYDDYKLLNFGIGFTNIVARTTRGSADLSRKEIKEGAQILTEKLKKYKPKIAVFNGKGIYEVFVGHKNFAIGKQPEVLPGTETTVYVMPSSSARCSQLPRAVDKVPFYASLKKLRDYLRGDLKELSDSEVCFPDLELKIVKKEPKQEIKEDMEESCCMQNIPNSQNGHAGYPPTNMHIKQEAGFNPMSTSSQDCISTSSQQYYNNQSNYSNHGNELVSYQMNPQSRGDQPQNYMGQNSMGANSIQMSQVMVQGQVSQQNFHMYQGSAQSYSTGHSSGAFAFQQSIQVNGINHQASSQVMVQSSFQGSQYPSTGYNQNMMNQGSYMNYNNQGQPMYNQESYSQNSQGSQFNNDVTFMGFSHGQEGQDQTNYNQSFNFVKPEPKDFSDHQSSSCCNGQGQYTSSSLQHDSQMTGYHDQQSHMTQNCLPVTHIKEEPKDLNDLTGNSCQSINL